MCAWCKKIEQGGRWIALEAYAQDHFRAEFTHGICPDCCRVLEAQGQK